MGSVLARKAFAEGLGTLLLVIFGVVRGARGPHVAYAVAAVITAMCWATSSTSFANPAVTVEGTS